ncbi:hypothetical protein GQ53DRAFT_845389 [Thozetella sp. PMI_491]|nr:hypothetical protein GQ53DRAFT_845389 [Thozetella sp. PMI_491]
MGHPFPDFGQTGPPFAYPGSPLPPPGPPVPHHDFHNLPRAPQPPMASYAVPPNAGTPCLKRTSSKDIHGSAKKHIRYQPPTEVETINVDGVDKYRWVTPDGQVMWSDVPVAAQMHSGSIPFASYQTNEQQWNMRENHTAGFLGHQPENDSQTGSTQSLKGKEKEIFPSQPTSASSGREKIGDLSDKESRKKKQELAERRKQKKREKKQKNLASGNDTDSKPSSSTATEAAGDASETTSAGNTTTDPSVSVSVPSAPEDAAAQNESMAPISSAPASETRTVSSATSSSGNTVADNQDRPQGNTNRGNHQNRRGSYRGRSNGRRQNNNRDDLGDNQQDENNQRAGWNGNNRGNRAYGEQFGFRHGGYGTAGSDPAAEQGPYRHPHYSQGRSDNRGGHRGRGGNQQSRFPQNEWSQTQPPAEW